MTGSPLCPHEFGAPHGPPRNCSRAWAGALTTLAFALSAAGLFGQMREPIPPPDVLKRMSVEELLNVQVTSVSKRPEKLSETASSIQVITGDDIRRAGATRLPEALRLASDLEVAQIDSRQWAISARGFNNVFADKLLVLIDGRSVYTPLYAGVYWDVQDTMLEDIDRIEVISGPGATQWGANAVNGVINVTTKSAKDTQGGLVSVEVGSELENSEEVRYGGRLGPGVYYRVYAKQFNRGDSVRPNGMSSNDAWRMGQAGFRIDYDADTESVLTLQGDVYAGHLDQPRRDNILVDGGNLLGRWSRTFAGDSEVRIQVYYDHTYRLIPNSFTQRLDTYDFDLQHHVPLGATQDITWGFGYRFVQDEIGNTPANAFLPPRVGHQWYSAFVQDEIALGGDDVHLTVGSKLEHNAYTGFEVEPSARIAWKAGRRQMVWAAISRAVRTPSRIDRDLFSPATPPYRVAGGGKVVSEKLVACEAGYRAQVGPSLGLSLAGFVNDYGDLRSLEPLNPPQPFPVEASSGFRGRSTGAELTAELQAASCWQLRAGWTELRVHSEPQPDATDRAAPRSIGRDPNHQVFLRSLIDLSSRWEIDASLRYVSRIRPQFLAGYAEADLRLGWRPAVGWEISLVGQNLLHPRHAEFYAPGSRAELQRAIYSKVSWRF